MGLDRKAENIGAIIGFSLIGVLGIGLLIFTLKIISTEKKEQEISKK